MSDLTTLIAVEEEIANVLAIVDELPEGEQEVAWSYLDELRLTEAEAIDGVGRAVRRRQNEIDFLKEEEKRIKNRRQSMEKRLEEFREYLSQIFQREGIQQIRGLKCTAYLRKSSFVEITDLSLLPSDFVETRIDFIPRKALIKEQLKNGEEVPGARMAERHSLVIN